MQLQSNSLKTETVSTHHQHMRYSGEFLRVKYVPYFALSSRRCVHKLIETFEYEEHEAYSFQQRSSIWWNWPFSVSRPHFTGQQIKTGGLFIIKISNHVKFLEQNAFQFGGFFRRVLTANMSAAKIIKRTKHFPLFMAATCPCAKIKLWTRDEAKKKVAKFKKSTLRRPRGKKGFQA
jgi:hypothetical protein